MASVKSLIFYIKLTFEAESCQTVKQFKNYFPCKNIYKKQRHSFEEQMTRYVAERKSFAR